MTIAELLAQLERLRSQAEFLEATGSLAKAYALVAEKVRELDGVPAIATKIDTTTAGQIEGVDRSTIAKRCADGWYPNAEKTSDGGEWRIPLSDLQKPTRPGHAGWGPQTPTLIQAGRS